MPASGYPRISLIYDAAASEGSYRLAESVGLHPVALEAVTPDALQQKRAVIVDVDLKQLAKVTQLRQALASIGPQVPLLFSVDRGRQLHAAQIQANALGARTILQRPLEPEAVRRALRELGVAVEPPQSDSDAEPGGASIKVGARLLDGAFKALRAGTPLDVGEALGASRQLLAGVGEAGLQSWLETVRGHHDGTFQHCLLVTGAAVAYALQAGLSARDRLTLTVAALLHDIGKAEIPLGILDKPGKLTDDEFAVIKRHPLIARDYLLTQQNLPAEVIAAVTQHHEYLDGSGYPHQLQGHQIAPLARLLTVCDVYGALVERRAYKSPKTPYEAIMILSDMARQGKVDYPIVRTLGLAAGVTLRAAEFRLR